MPFLRPVGSKRAKLERDMLRDRGGGLRDRGGIVGVEVLFVYLKWLNSLQGSFFIFTFVAIYLDEDLTRKKDVYNHGK